MTYTPEHKQETMTDTDIKTCAICHEKQRGENFRPFDWTHFSIDRSSFYVCWRHFPKGGDSAQAYQRALTAIIKRLAEIHTGKLWGENHPGELKDG